MALSAGGPWLPDAQAFVYNQVDARGPGQAWGKGVGDLDNDGQKDLVVGGWATGNPGLYWYKNPGWTKRTISATAGIGTDVEVADVNRDGRRDVVAITRIAGRHGVTWFENRGSSWVAHAITSSRVLHDVEVSDVDGDGRLDVVGRNQGASGTAVHLWRQNGPDAWSYASLTQPSSGEGMAVADLDRDGKPDIVVNRYWLKNTSRPGSPSFARYLYNAAAAPKAFVAVGDLDGDGRVDIVTTPAESAGQHYRAAWFQQPAAATAGTWTEHVIENNIECVVHFAGIADFNGDGRNDVATAMMQQGRSPKIKVYYNQGGGRFGAPTIVANASSHSMRIVDVAGRKALFGADWNQKPITPVKLWRQ